MLAPESTSRPGALAQRRWFPFLGTLVVVALCAAFGPGSMALVDADPEFGDPALAPVDNCGACEDDPLSNVHLAVQYQTPQSGWNRGGGWHGWWYEGHCLFKHGLCIFGTQGGKSSIAQANPADLVGDIVRATGDRDIARLARLARTPSVQINASRMLMQVVACDGEHIVGHVPIDSALLAAVAEAADQDID